MPSATDIAQAREIPLSAGLFIALFLDVPFLDGLDARPAEDTKFMSLRLVGLPTAGPFINYNEGFTSDEALLAMDSFDCSLVGGQVKAEQISAAKWNKTHGKIGYTWFDLQVEAKLKAQGLALEKQVIYGQSYDPKGFPGFRDLTPYVSTNVLTLLQTAASKGFARSVLDAGGTTQGTASSVYALIEGEQDVQLVVGTAAGAAEGEFFSMTDLITSNEAPNPSEPSKKSFHDVQQFHGHIGLSVAGMNQTPNSVVPTQYSLRRLCNVTADSGHTLNDGMMSKLSRSFGNNKRPTKFVMNTRSGEQLGASRQPTAINVVVGQTGDAAKATFNTYPEPPDNWRGIPIIYADNTILETDNIEQ